MIRALLCKGKKENFRQRFQDTLPDDQQFLDVFHHNFIEFVSRFIRMDLSVFTER